jgi:hypothetical protein
VFTFWDAAPGVAKEFVALELAHGAANATSTLRVTDNHFVYAAAEGGAPRLVHAKRVAVGDTMWVAGAQAAEPARVVGVSRVAGVGAYAPFTLAGPIVVDGVVAHSMADLRLPGGRMLADVLPVPPAWYSASAAHLRLLYRAGAGRGLQGASVWTRNALVVAARAVAAPLMGGASL